MNSVSSPPSAADAAVPARPAVGSLFVITAPSGTGKTTISNYLRSHYGLRISVSYTTRPPRKTETEDQTYHFIDDETFLKMRDEGAFLEWAQVYGHYYGTPRAHVCERLDTGHSIFLEIDVAGAKQVKASYPDAILIFIMPPSMEELVARLDARDTETEEVKQIRLAAAEKEIAQKDFFDYVIINDHLNEAIAQIIEVVKKHAPHSH